MAPWLCNNSDNRRGFMIRISTEEIVIRGIKYEAHLPEYLFPVFISQVYLTERI